MVDALNCQLFDQADDAVGFYSAARGNLLGAGHIFRALPPTERNINPCIQFLLGFAIECYFKAYLAYTGCTEKRLRKVGHDLKLAMQDAERQGLVLSNRPQMCFVVECIAHGHQTHNFRYLPGNSDGNDGSHIFVYPRTAFEAISPLDETIFRIVQADINAEEERLGLVVTAA